MRKLTFLMVCLLILSVATVCFAEIPKYGGIWKDAIQNNPPYLDPVMATDTTSAEIGYQLFYSFLATLTTPKDITNNI